MWIDKVIINKSGNKGEASVYLADDGVEIIINKIQIDTTNGANPVDILKAGGTPVISGKSIDDLKEELLDMFLMVKSYKVGMFEFTDEGVCKLGE